MDINVKIKFESPEIMNALLALAEALPQIKLGNTVPIKEVKEAKEETKEAELKTEEIKKLTLEDVREKLALLSQSGKQAAVKELITKFGAKKLTDIDPARYEELLKEAEVF